MIVFNVDKALSKFGFSKTYESDIVINYEKKTKFGYTQVLEICNKESGKHILSSYEKGINKNGFNNSVGIEPKVAKLLIKKMRRKGWK